MVLVHEVHIGVPGDLTGKESRHLGGAGKPTRQDEVPYQKSAPGDPGLVQHQIADLTVHLLYRHPVERDIIART